MPRVSLIALWPRVALSLRSLVPLCPLDSRDALVTALALRARAALSARLTLPTL